MEAIGLKTTRYSAVLRRLLEAHTRDVEIRIDRERYTGLDVPRLLAEWCNNRDIRATRNFEIRWGGLAVAGFHDGPSQLWVAASERPLVDALVRENLARVDAGRTSDRITRRL